MNPQPFAVYKVAYQREGGYIPIPEAPGLGIELDDSLIEQNPVSTDEYRHDTAA